MADRKPLVLDDTAQVQQLQRGDEVDIPLEQRHRELEHRFNALVTWLQMQGFEIPDELML